MIKKGEEHATTQSAKECRRARGFRAINVGGSRTRRSDHPQGYAWAKRQADHRTARSNRPLRDQPAEHPESNRPGNIRDPRPSLLRLRTRSDAAGRDSVWPRSKFLARNRRRCLRRAATQWQLIRTPKSAPNRSARQVRAEAFKTGYRGRARRYV